MNVDKAERDSFVWFSTILIHIYLPYNLQENIDVSNEVHDHFSHIIEDKDCKSGRTHLLNPEDIVILHVTSTLLSCPQRLQRCGDNFDSYSP